MLFILLATVVQGASLYKRAYSGVATFNDYAAQGNTGALL
jgi:hypothetical protein